MLQVNGLTKYYGNARGIHDVSFAVEYGEVFGLIGPHGAGKSTAIRCMMDLTAKSGGEVLIDERLFDRNTPKRRAAVGCAMQRPALYDEMSVGEVIRFHGAFYRAVDEARLGRLIRRLEIDMTAGIGTLGAAEAKKLALVLALMHKPRVILLDDPMGELMPMDREIVLEILREEKARGTAIVLATDNLADARRICDRAAILRAGQVLIEDRMENLVNGFVQLVTLECADPGIAQRLGGMAIEREGDTVRFLYEGEPAKLIGELAGLQVKRLLIEEPHLDDIIDNYYQ